MFSHRVCSTQKSSQVDRCFSIIEIGWTHLYEKLEKFNVLESSMDATTELDDLDSSRLADFPRFVV